MSTETPDETIARLTESNRRLANQIVGYGDRMQQAIAGIVKDARVEALREVAADLADESPFHNIIDTEAHWQIGGKWAAKLRARADNLEAS